MLNDSVGINKFAMTHAITTFLTGIAGKSDGEIYKSSFVT